MKTKKYILLFLLVVFCISDCKKYPDGPRISLLTKMCRITGVWDVEYYEVDGIDSTSYILNSPYYYRLYFQRGHKSCIGDGFSPLDLIFVNKNISAGCAGWGLSRSKEILGIDIAFSTAGFHPLGGAWKDSSWEIQRLTNKELWLKQSSTKYYPHINFMKLKKISEKP